MADFPIRFLLSNLYISGIIGLLFLVKRIFRSTLSGRMQYHLWFLMLALMAIPFIPLVPTDFSRIFSWVENLNISPTSSTPAVIHKITNTSPLQAASRINDFAVSVSRQTLPATGFILFGIWATGMLIMLLLLIRSNSRLNKIKKSALPLQNSLVHRLYDSCLAEMKIKKDIPIYSTAFLTSPIIAGYFEPCIYLPIHLLSDYKTSAMRYMLLHELQHYKHRDSLVNILMNIAGILYWFNPFVWMAFKEMRSDREVACDTAVLKMLAEENYADYGNTLIQFAEKVSRNPFPFATGISGNMRQMKKRIRNIATYEKPTFLKQLKGFTAFLITAALLVGLAPLLCTYAADTSRYQWHSSDENISYIDCSSYFDKYDGSFVLYDLQNNVWNIHNLENATLRVSPNSTYKIYDALFGLEEKVITPDNSFIPWNNEIYPFEAWNADQTLQSAMHSSVNWYFQTVDEQIGAASVNSYMQAIGYGNENIDENFPTYWMESSLEISPIEQVELLTKLYNNSFGFAPENINAVKDSICLSSSENGTFYGKTGTGRIDGQDVNGWFIGYIEAADNTYFFATNIGAESGATGSNATEITMSILSDMNIWRSHTAGM